MRVASAFIASAGLLLGGCASIVSGHNQSVSVETLGATGAVAGASCQLSNDKGKWFVTTPGSTVVSRSYGDLAVKCEKDGHQPGLLTVKSTTKPMAFGNVLFGGVIGAGVDMATGAAYDYPALISVLLGQSGVLAPPPTAAVDPQPGQVGQMGPRTTSTAK